MTLVSIIVPTHDRRALVRETLASVHEQTVTDWELIVVDDASSDDTTAYLETLTDPRIRTARHDTVRGVSAARNTGLALARGELVMFVDDDDLLRPDAVAMLRQALGDHPHALAASAACRLFHADGDSSRVYRAARADCRTIWREVLFGWWSNSGQNMYRTSVVRDIGGFDTSLRFVQDRMLWLEVARRGPVCLVPRVAMEYRQHSAQLTKSPGIEVERQQIWTRFIHSLPSAQQPEGRRIRRAAELSARAEAARAASRFAEGARLQVAAFAAVPGFLFSPLVARPMYWNLKKCLQRRTFP
ncbi:MAG TPA: glycosyltransferase family A protein [Gemmatimonadaceae bacterium]|nr:glycosyltransferase family A protein [Gemmatimonadaceae bacterium]